MEKWVKRGCTNMVIMINVELYKYGNKMITKKEDYLLVVNWGARSHGVIHGCVQHHKIKVFTIQVAPEFLKVFMTTDTISLHDTLIIGEQVGDVKVHLVGRGAVFSVSRVHSRSRRCG